MNVVVFTPALVHGDAVSHDVLSMVAALRRRGYRADAAARWIKDDIAAIPLDRMPEQLSDPDDVLIYHHSIGLEEAVRTYEQLPCRKFIKYHNVTPPRFFEQDNKEVARACALGLKQTARLLSGCVALWCDSDFNGRDLQKDQITPSPCPLPRSGGEGKTGLPLSPALRGEGRVRGALPYEVLPPFNQVDALIAAEPDPTAVALYDDWLTNILVVGRIVPNKNNLLAVEAFAEYRQRFDPHARLIFVGDVAQNKYCDRVIERIRQLKLSRHVCITGKISDRQLKTLYLTAQALLTTSSHEGFCLPLVEAMALRVPIVAVANAAIPETAGDAALYADTEPLAIAETLRQLRTSAVEREERLQRGWERYRQTFTNELIEAKFGELFELGTRASSGFGLIEQKQPIAISPGF